MASRVVVRGAAAAVAVGTSVAWLIGERSLGPAELALLAPLAVGLVLVAVALVRPVEAWTGSRYTDRWLDRHGLPRRRDVQQLVRNHLSRTARWRLAGSVVGAVAALYLGRFMLVWALAGYLAGAIVAAALAPPLVTGDAPRRARLQTRTAAAYLPAWALRLWRAAPLAVVVLGAALLVTPLRPAAAAPVAGTELVLAAVVTGAVVAGQRRVLRRPQPVVDEALIQADDALRSAAVRALTGCGIAALLMVCSNLLWSLGAADVQLLRWVAPWLAVAAMLGGLLAWARLTGVADVSAAEPLPAQGRP